MVTATGSIFCRHLIHRFIEQLFLFFLLVVMQFFCLLILLLLQRQLPLPLLPESLFLFLAGRVLYLRLFWGHVLKLVFHSLDHLLELFLLCCLLL